MHWVRRVSQKRWVFISFFMVQSSSVQSQFLRAMCSVHFRFLQSFIHFNTWVIPWPCKNVIACTCTYYLYAATSSTYQCLWCSTLCFVTWKPVFICAGWEHVFYSHLTSLCEFKSEFGFNITSCNTFFFFYHRPAFYPKPCILTLDKENSWQPKCFVLYIRTPDTKLFSLLNSVNLHSPPLFSSLTFHNRTHPFLVFPLSSIHLSQSVQSAPI